MTDSTVIDLPLPDASARQRIETDLSDNLLVEAGAGSGKTTALVSRMVAHVLAGTPIESLAAVTFTRKAAAELRERFQAELERTLLAERAADQAEHRERLETALLAIDSAFIGTIHGFCARLLRERPLEVGLDPAFEELPLVERAQVQTRFWESFLERLTRDADPVLEEVTRAGLNTKDLRRLFDRLVENSDIDFPAPDADPPSVAETADELERLRELVDRGRELMPEKEPDGGWDDTQRRLRTLDFNRHITGWAEPADIFDAIESLVKHGKTGHRITQKKWRDAEMAKQLRDDLNAFGLGDTPAKRLLDRWLAHRYAIVIRLVETAARDFRRYRIRSGRLDFQDLLQLTAQLLRENAPVRRQLGSRYRYLLVDEFQDTDPLQAEIMLLLSSEPANEEDEGEWRDAEPREGALFVVGDPKQSIYRFRRADIQLYQFVRARFEAFGTVLKLTANFRSRPPIADVVNEYFPAPDRFPEAHSAEQAAFEPLNPRRPDEPEVEGVFFYDLEPTGSRKADLVRDDAARLASWIRERIEDGSRDPADFLILTRQKAPLASYARALEARGVAVQVTGGGVGREAELEELEMLLECLIDPANPVKVVAVLVGLFFGLDYEALVEHRMAGGHFDVHRPGDRGDETVRHALSLLHRWWRESTTEPADVFVSRLVSELGLLPFAAAGELGPVRAGAVVFALDAIRESTLRGGASLPAALDALRAALDLPDAEAPLEPDRPDAVRVMNLHQAKGLEAPVVVLADPSPKRSHTPSMHIERSHDGVPLGFMHVKGGSGWGRRPIAAPPGWDEKEAREQRFEDAEQVRLLYVAVTRARDELVVARHPGSGKPSAWSGLDDWLDERATRLELEIVEPPERPALQDDVSQVRADVEAASAMVSEMAVPTVEHVSVTRLAKGEIGTFDGDSPIERSDPSDYRGVSWGSVVHGALAAAAGGSEAGALRASCRDLLVDEGRPLDDQGEPLELGDLMALVDRVLASPLWERSLAAERRLVEIPFAATLGAEEEPVEAEPEPEPEPAPEKPQLDLFAGGREPPDEPAEASEADDALEAGSSGPAPVGVGSVRIVEGVIDLAFLEDDGWVIADYKTDVGTDPGFPERAVAYRRQVELYAEAWASLTRRRVKERVLFFTAQDRVESW